MLPTKVLGITATALLILLAAMATPALGLELPEFSSETGFTGKTGALVFVNSKSSITCTSSEIAATATSKKGGTFKMTANKCTTLGGLIKCNSEGAAAETILASGEWQLVPAESGTMVLVSPKAIAITCSTEHLEVKGSFLDRILDPLDTKAKSFELLLQQAEGAQEVTQYENDAGEKKTAVLEVSINKGAFTTAAIEATAPTFATEKEVEITKIPTFSIHAKRGRHFMLRKTSEDLVITHGLIFFNAKLKEIKFTTTSAAFAVNKANLEKCAKLTYEGLDSCTVEVLYTEEGGNPQATLSIVEESGASSSFVITGL